MKMTIYEGTSEEIAKIARAMQSSPAENTLPLVSSTMPTPSEEPKSIKGVGSNSRNAFISSDIALRAFTRRRLSNTQKKLLRKLMSSSPNWASRDELLEETGYTANQFAGLVGALGRRVSHTQGYVDGTSWIDVRRNDSLSTLEYRLPESTHQALSEISIKYKF